MRRPAGAARTASIRAHLAHWRAVAGAATSAPRFTPALGSTPRNATDTPCRSTTMAARRAGAPTIRHPRGWNCAGGSRSLGARHRSDRTVALTNMGGWCTYRLRRRTLRTSWSTTVRTLAWTRRRARGWRRTSALGASAARAGCSFTWPRTSRGTAAARPRARSRPSCAAARRSRRGATATASRLTSRPQSTPSWLRATLFASAGARAGGSSVCRTATWRRGSAKAGSGDRRRAWSTMSTTCSFSRGRSARATTTQTSSLRPRANETWSLRRRRRRRVKALAARVNARKTRARTLSSWRMTSTSTAGMRSACNRQMSGDARGWLC
mmetsp:Transcript_10146/g.31768  ORF Transcript_10146/g.31768 Transcript_10146/m.31768 type:complete len:325 (-) Transcript_10146:117-1091(-)